MKHCPSHEWDKYCRTTDEDSRQADPNEEQRYLEEMARDWEQTKAMQAQPETFDHYEVDDYGNKIVRDTHNQDPHEGMEWTGAREGSK